MRYRLDAETIASLPTDHRRDFADEACRGLYVRVTTAGHRSWCVVYWQNGRKRRYLLGDCDRVTPAQARAAARKELARAALGADPQAERVAARRRPAGRVLTVAEIVRGMLAAVDLRPSTRTGWEGVAKGEILASALGRRPADQLIAQDVRRWVRAIAERRAHGANRALAVLKRAYSWAFERDLVGGNPCVGVRKPTPEAQSDRVLTDAELWALLSSLRLIDRVAGRQHDESILAHVAVTRLLLLTVVRRDAALGARREEFTALDGPDARWVVPGGRAGRSKSGRPHVVPLSPAAAAIVRQRLSVVRGSCLFPGLALDAGEPERAMVWRSDFVAALRRLVVRRLGAEVPRWTIHNFRTAFATHARESLGIYGNEVPLILGHALPGPAVTKTYDRSVLLRERRLALVAWADWLNRLDRPRRTRMLPS